MDPDGPPDLDDLRALARSAPWRRRTLRLRVTWHPGAGPDGPLPPVEGGPVRAWVSGRHGLRVEDLATGRLLTASWSPSPGGWTGTGPAGVEIARRRGLPVLQELGEHLVGVDDYGVDDPRAPRPRLRPDGLVAERPPAHSGPDGGIAYDAPLWQTYRWVAMLDPVELADGAPPPDDGGRSGPDAGLRPVRLVTTGPGGPGDLTAGVTLVDHHGRPAWEAVVAPTAAYDPRCSCCPLLPGEVASRYLSAEGGDRPRPVEVPAGGWPTAHRVRLDVGTGVVVGLEQLDGHGAGNGWTAVVEAVDETYDRSWFSDAG